MEVKSSKEEKEIVESKNNDTQYKLLIENEKDKAYLTGKQETLRDGSDAPFDIKYSRHENQKVRLSYEVGRANGISIYEMIQRQNMPFTTKKKIQSEEDGKILKKII